VGAAEGGSARHRLALRAALALAYPALAVAATWPLATDLGGLLPLGTLGHSTVPLTMVWSLWWTADRLAEGFAGYWDAPILFPARSIYASSEPMALLGIVASPLFFVGLPPVLSANLVLLAMLALNGWMAFGLLRRLGVGELAAALGGACVVVLPYAHREIAVLHLVPLAGILGALWAGIAWSERPSTPRALVLGVAMAATYLTSAQYALYLALAGAPAFVWWIGRRHFRPRALLGLAAGVMLCGGLIAPVVRAQVEAARLYRMERPVQIAQAGSALPRDWWAATWPAVVPIPLEQPPRRIDRLGLHPGSVKLALALVGAFAGFRSRALRRRTAFVTTLLAGSLLVSMLPVLGGGVIFEPLRTLLPGLGEVRSFYRAGVFAQLAVVALAALGLDALLRRARAAAGSRPPRARWLRAAAVALGLLAVVDLWPRQQRFAAAPSLEAWAPWTRWIESNVGPDQAILYLPMITRGRMDRFEAEARWMFLQTAHGRPMANGFWGLMPRDSLRIASAAAQFPHPRAHRVLASVGVRWVVLRPSWLDTLAAATVDRGLWRPAFESEPLDVAVYEVIDRGGALGR